MTYVLALKDCVMERAKERVSTTAVRTGILKMERIVIVIHETEEEHIS